MDVDPFACFDSVLIILFGSEEEYKNIIQDNIIMELNDDDPSSKLLGVQIDIDLEDKGKSSEDMK